ncbi:signal peptidase I [Microbacterium sp. 4R-513]|uniref:signal peptidase I n=1 Tax=Microbacterium sp. 4R-513 TaxID=2567934 RepID=UPI0013E1A309|nr:signal peptidase I [Microbacterium sp. 4R-513]QIG39049.1 signal peptidase I [Microbacterium sp. 4R-513]
MSAATTFKALGNAAVVIAAVIACVVAALMFVPGLLGYDRYVITGGSMSGTFERGSLTLEQQVPVSELRAGDIITYLPPAESGISELVTHRIVSIEPNPDGSDSLVFQTKGDANESIDPWTFTLADTVQPRGRGMDPRRRLGLHRALGAGDQDAGDRRSGRDRRPAVPPRPRPRRTPPRRRPLRRSGHARVRSTGGAGLAGSPGRRALSAARHEPPCTTSDPMENPMAPARALGRRRPLAWAAAIVLAALSMLNLVAAAAGDPLHNPIALVWGALGVVGVITLARFVTAQCFESRLGMILVGGGTLVAVLLIHTVGAPGLPVAAWSPRDIVLIALSCALVGSWRATARTPRP